MLLAGEGIKDITPPLGVELAGFHKPPGQERKITAIRKPTMARALVLQAGQSRVAIVALDILGLSEDFARRLGKRVSAQTGIPADHVRVCATHSHSAPSLAFLRQWGCVSKEYDQQVERQASEAVAAAVQDLAEADFYLGKQAAEKANHNRTAKKWRTDAEFTKASGPEERWLDTTLHALFFLREEPKKSLLWYQFSAHPVCYTDTLAGPDWPGLVAAKTLERDGYQAAFLQGHCGDVNPGDGSTSLGNPEKVSEAVWTALHHATSHSENVPVPDIQSVQSQVRLPLDLARLNQELERYEKDPAACTSGEWVDAAFAKDWHAAAVKWPRDKEHYTVQLSAIRLGDVALLFHPAELYSYYGLLLRRDSPFSNTIVCGYADGFIGYVTDPKAYPENEYAAVVVPKILGLPLFKPSAGAELVRASLELLANLKPAAKQPD